MLAIFGSASAGGSGLFSNPLVTLLMVALGIFIFLKFCSWARNLSIRRAKRLSIFLPELVWSDLMFIIRWGIKRF